MTPEERAVIEAAKALFMRKVKHRGEIRAGRFGLTDTERNLMALEESDDELTLMRAVDYLLQAEQRSK